VAKKRGKCVGGLSVGGGIKKRLKKPVWTQSVKLSKIGEKRGDRHPKSLETKSHSQKDYRLPENEKSSQND